MKGDEALGKEEALYVAENTVAYCRNWQEPAATEKAAFEAVRKHKSPLNFVFIGFPWATLIDAVNRRSALVERMFDGLCQVQNSITDPNQSSVVTVVQHIHADRFVSLYKSLGVTDMFWAHSTRSMSSIDDVRVHPFPLYPAQVSEPDRVKELHKPRRWLANFIGAYNPKVYLSDVRQKIFDHIGEEDLLIVKRESWHFDRAVYEQQIAGVSPDAAKVAQEERDRREYLDAIKESVFTLCPTGSGPNSIRIYESLALGSIPVILTHDLSLPINRELWEAACVFEEDSARGYHRAVQRIRRMGIFEIRQKQLASYELYSLVCPDNYARILDTHLSSICQF